MRYPRAVRGLYLQPELRPLRPAPLPHRFDELAESLRLIWRDVNGLDGVEQTLAGASALAEASLGAALAFAESVLVRRHGTPRNAEGVAQRLVVIAMGKLGGGELNFSSDIDLVFLFPEFGDTDGVRSIANEEFFTRLGQALIRLLDARTVDGFVFRIDMRLRPFGAAGRLALSFVAMEQYYQREGRDWERYAWIKARPVAGDKAAGNRLLATLRPFVFRRYFDYTAFAGMREMKALIDAGSRARTSPKISSSVPAAFARSNSSPRFSSSSAADAIPDCKSARPCITTSLAHFCAMDSSIWRSQTRKTS